MEPLNLCIASPIYYPYFGGASNRFRKYLPQLKERGINPHVLTGTLNKHFTERRDVTPDWLNMKLGETNPIQYVDETSVQRVRLPYESARKAETAFGKYVVKSCIESNEKVDVVQFVSTSPWLSNGLYQLRKLNIPSLLAYTLIAEYSPNPVKRIYQKLLWNIPFKLSNCVVTNSSRMKESLQKRGVTTRIEVIANGVDIKRFHPPQNRDEVCNVRKKLNIKSTDQVVINVGTIEPRKGTDLLVKAWSNLAALNKNLHLILVGPRQNTSFLESVNFYNNLINEIETKKLVDRVHFLDYVPDVETYLRISDLFVFTSVREGLPNAVFEAMASHLPVITTNFDGISAEMGQAGQHYLLLSERNHTQLTQLMDKVLNDKTIQENLGSSGRKLVEDTFSLDVTLDKYSDLYRELSA